MTSKGLGEMFEGDSADMCAGKILLTSMGGRVEGLTCADLGARTPIGASRNSNNFLLGRELFNHGRRVFGQHHSLLNS